MFQVFWPRAEWRLEFGELSKKGDEEAIQLGSKRHCTQEKDCCPYFTVVHVLCPRSPLLLYTITEFVLQQVMLSYVVTRFKKNIFRKNIDKGLTLRAQGLRSIWKVHIVSGIYSIHILQPKIVQDCFVSMCFFTGLILSLRILMLISWPSDRTILQYYYARIPEMNIFYSFVCRFVQLVPVGCLGLTLQTCLYRKPCAREPATQGRPK